MNRNRLLALLGITIVFMMAMLRLAMSVLGMDVHFRWNR